MSRRKSLTVEEKANIIWKLEAGESNSSLSKEFGVSHSTISTVWANKEKIKRSFEEESFSTKKIRKTQHTDLDNTLLSWFKTHRTKNVPINGPILLMKAQEFSVMLKKDFKPDASWIQRFRNRHNIVFAKISGESAAVPPGVKDHWLSSVWPKIREGYSNDEIFNCDETGLFYKLTPDKTFKFLGEKCSGGKHSKERITVLIAANFTGSEKKKLVVIGKSKKPRCFKNLKNLPVQYEHNSRSWMTSQLFEKILHEWDTDLRRKKKKMLLLVDNCPAHPHVASLQCIKLVFLPANTTSVLQPMDQGVIQTLKVNFRKLLVLKMIENIEKGIEVNINLLEAIIMISKAWERVESETIAHCFRHAGFNSDSPDSETTTNESLAEWVLNMDLPQQIANKNIDFNQYATIDEDVETSTLPTDVDIIASVTQMNDENDSSDDDNVEATSSSEFCPPSASTAMNAMSTVRSFFSFEEEPKQHVKEAMIVLEKEIEKIYYNKHSIKQKLITDFF